MDRNEKTLDEFGLDKKNEWPMWKKYNEVTWS